MRLSVGRTDSCLDNVVAESFFGAFKNEVYCNRRRPHSSIGYECLTDRMAAFLERADGAAAREGPLAA